MGQGAGQLDFKSRCVDGRPFEIFSDVVDRDGRCQKIIACDCANGPSQ